MQPVTETMETTDSILEFWFGGHTSNREINDHKKSLWWSKNDQADQQIKERFESISNAVYRGEKPEMQRSARGLLASIICLDQFPRNMYRGTARSFAFDQVALRLAIEMVDKAWDQTLPPIYRLFAWLPFEHSEDIAMQDKSVMLYDNLRKSVEPDERDMFDEYYRFAYRHFEIIDRFGRYPHRNRILGRESTAEELAFLSQPGSSF